MKLTTASVSDSLIQLYNTSDNDSLKARYCLQLGDYYENLNIDQAINWGEKAIVHSRKFNDKLFILKTLVYASYFHNRKGSYHNQVKLCLEAMEIAEKNNFKDPQGSIASNIGGAYINLGDNDQALYWLERAIELKKKYNSKEKLAYSISALGAYYFDLGDYNNAAKYDKEALELRRELDDRESMAVNLGNLASCYIELSRYNEASNLLEEALSIRKENDDDYGVLQVMLNYSSLYNKQKNYQRAIAYADSAYQIAIDNNYDDQHYETAKFMAELYASIGNHKVAYQYETEAREVWQELYTAESNFQLNELRTIYGTEKIENENLLLKKDAEIKDLDIEKGQAEISKQRTIIGASIAGLLLLVGLVFLLNKWNREKRKTNKELSEQKHLVETKNIEILDSIRYAKRIQAAILPPTGRMKNLFPESFVLYKPKDVVAGDFYWIESKGDIKLFAVADCTGHGVPGAMVSVFANNSLNRAVREHGLTDPGKILDKSREIVLEEFDKSDEDVSDGMDICLCALKGNLLQFAGAYNPLWIVRNGELKEYRGDKQPVGRFENSAPFTTTEISLQSGDTLYLFSDGFADQFGGDQGKKFMKAKFKRLLIENAALPLDQQKRMIEAEFEAWKGNHEQVDDVCVMGIKIT